MVKGSTDSEPRLLRLHVELKETSHRLAALIGSINLSKRPMRVHVTFDCKRFGMPGTRVVFEIEAVLAKDKS